MFALLGSSHLCSLNCFVSVSLLSFLSLAETLWNDCMHELQHGGGWIAFD